MAFNWQTFTTRAISGLTFAGIMIAGLLWNAWSFLFLFTIVHFGCWHEYLRLVERIRQVQFHIYTKLGFMLLGYGGMLMFAGHQYDIAGYSIRGNASLPLTIAGFMLLVIGIFREKRVQAGAFGMAAIGWLYISLSWGLMLDLYEDWGGMPYLIPVVLILSIWVNDTMAYIVGSFIGRTPLTSISPKKTWEGTIGGMLLAIIAISVLFPLLFMKGRMQVFDTGLVAISALAAISGTFGDLLESLLKRKAGVKDSGNMMPGHGGFLDRFDSLLLATPCCWLIYMLFRH
ncbi:phosphatidate cytidylyltransferase [Nostoc ellipsosporum NOK]|nr:phosphatidate cytidylyltransferase [Nostoc ellipsosporum NOK]